MKFSKPGTLPGIPIGIVTRYRTYTGIIKRTLVPQTNYTATEGLQTPERPTPKRVRFRESNKTPKCTCLLRLVYACVHNKSAHLMPSACSSFLLCACRKVLLVQAVSRRTRTDWGQHVVVERNSTKATCTQRLRDLAVCATELENCVVYIRVFASGADFGGYRSESQVHWFVTL